MTQTMFAFRNSTPPGRAAAGPLRLALLAGLAIAGCTAPRVSQQKLLSQPSMTFGASRIWSHDPGLTAQLEPGRANSGGGSSAGCTSCR